MDVGHLVHWHRNVDETKRKPSETEPFVIWLKLNGGSGVYPRVLVCTDLEKCRGPITEECGSLVILAMT